MIAAHEVLHKNDKLEEVILGLREDYPYTSIYAPLDRFVSGCAPWHWHQEFEFFIVLEGTINYHIEDGVHSFSEGDGGFINSNVLHMTSPADNRSVATNVQIMDRRFIAGNMGSLIDTKYVTPVINSAAMNIIPFHQDNPEEKRLLDLLQSACKVENMKAAGYEFIIRNIISDMWFYFFRMTEPLRMQGVQAKSLDSQRIKSMIAFINSHYNEKLTLAAISQSADISEREALRCFQRSVKLTPFEYLTGRRVQRAVDLLLGTDEPIILVGELCGFSSASYFSKVFKEKMGCTPKKFRDSHSVV